MAHNEDAPDIDADQDPALAQLQRERAAMLSALEVVLATAARALEQLRTSESQT